MPTSSSIVTGPQQVAVESLAQLRVQLVGGSVEIVGRTEPGVTIDVLDVTGAPLEVTSQGDRVSIGYPSLGWEGWAKRLASFRSGDAATLRISVADSVQVSVATVAAAGHVQDLAEDLTLTSASAAMTAERCRGEASARTVSGTVVIHDHTGPCGVVTVSGAVHVSGDVPRLTVTTVSGAVSAEPRSPSSVISVSTVSAGATIAVNPATSLDLAVRAVSGSVQVNGVERRTNSGPGVTSVVEGPSGGGTSFVKVTTVSGNVVVTQAAS